MRQPTGDNTLAGYVRQSSADITPTATLRAAPINAEYNKLRDAFAVSSGHKHDGSTGEGGYIPLIGDVDALNKVVIDTSNNRVGVFIEVSSAAVEQLRFQDGAIVPVTTNDIDLGTSSLEFKDLYLDGTAHIDTLDVDINGAVAGTFTIGSTLGVTGTTTLSTANITTGVITSVDINSGAIDNVTIGGTTAGAGTFTTINASGTSTLATVDIGAGAIDGTTIGANSASPATVTNLTATGTSTLSTVDINAGAIDGTTIGASSAAAGSFTTVNTSGQATLATVDINGGNIDGAIIGASATAAITGTTITGSSLVGPLTGNVSGNTAGVHTGNVTGNVTGNITASSGASTLNNLTVNGTLDVTGTTIANVTDPTNAQDAATKNYVDTEVSALVDSSPSALNTLNELAAAINDDASFSTTITNSIATKLPLAGGTMSGAIAMGTSKITGLGNPTANQDASTKAYVDSAALLKVGGTMSGALAMGNNKITGLATPTATTDATTKTYVDGILGSATVAATSATNAATSETNAATSATNASNSASAASTSATNAASSYDQFDDRYLGAKSSAPTVDNDGDALITGALYFNSTTNIMNVYGSGGWQSAGSAVNGTSERNTYTATAGQTVFAATYDSGYIDVFLNGVKLLAGTDFTATNGTSITLASGASVNDVVDIVAYGTFVLADHYTKIAADARYVNVAGDTMTGDLSFGDNDKAIFGAGSDLQIYHDGSHSYIQESGTGNLFVRASNLVLADVDGTQFLRGTANSDVKLYHNNDQKLATTSTGITVDGIIATINGTDIDMDSSASGQLKLDGDGYGAAIALNAQGMNIYTNSASRDIIFGTNETEVMRIDGAGLVGIGVSSPDEILDVRDGNAIVQVFDTTTVAQDVGGRINLSGYYTGTSENTYAQVLGKKENGTDANRRGYFAVRTRSVGAGLIERMRIDSDGDVGIGCTPSSKLHVSSAGSTVLNVEATGANDSRVRITAGNANTSYVEFADPDDVDTGEIRYSHSTNAMQFRTAGNVLGMLIDSSQNVGIGTDSPSTYSGALVVADGSVGGTSHVTVTNNNVNQFLKLGVSGDLAQIGYDDGDGIAFGQFTNSTGTSFSSEHMRIDSSGNLLVGKASESFGTEGIAFRGSPSSGASGSIFTRDGDNVAAFNRLTSDGDILSFSKDGATVGIIRSVAGAYMALGKGNTGLLFQDGLNEITPYDIAAGANEDAAINLGKSNARFKDAYLAGGIYLGGVGQANKLEDYEEGTWTPVLSFGGSNANDPEWYKGTYTKVGNRVFVDVRMAWNGSLGSNTGQARVTLPFSVFNSETNTQWEHIASFFTLANVTTTLVPAFSDTGGGLIFAEAQGTSNEADHTDFSSSSNFRVTGSYRTGS